VKAPWLLASTRSCRGGALGARFSLVTLLAAGAAGAAAELPSKSAEPPSKSDEAPPQSAVPLWQKLTETVDVYGRLAGYLSYSAHAVGFADNGSRFGFFALQKLQGGFSVFGQGEWSVNLGQGSKSFSLSDNPDTGLANVTSSSTNVIGPRLGFVGVGFGRYGTLTLGKQWSVYYDVSQWTDQYTVFGAKGSATYNAGTDGGPTGTGRADSAAVYRVTLGPVQLGVQAQFLQSRSAPVDALAGSVVYDFGCGLKLGMAYDRTFIGGSPNLVLVGQQPGGGHVLTGGLTFKRHGWWIASLGTLTQNQEFVDTKAGTVAYKTMGAELFMSYVFGGRVMPLAGFDLAIPRDLDTRYVNPRFATRSYIAGLRFLFEPKLSSFAFIEARSGPSYDQTGARVADVIVVGIRLEYSLRRALGLEH
jgi:predicted porin